jgi:glycerophosphoryl diester phosphodiesterase
VWVLGHRGQRIPGPRENTAAAVRAALAAGADGVEVDVRRSADGLLFCHHDARLPDGRPLVRCTAAELLAAGVAPAAEVLAAVDAAGARIVCEVKNGPADPDRQPTAADARRLLAAALAARPPGAVPATVSSFDARVVEAARAPGLTTALLVGPGEPVSPAVRRAGEVGARGLHLPVRTVLADPDPPGAVALAHRAGLEVFVWTVTRPAVLGALRAAGVDAAICDDPGAARAVLAR